MVSLELILRFNINVQAQSLGSTRLRSIVFSLGKTWVGGGGKGPPPPPQKAVGLKLRVLYYICYWCLHTEFGISRTSLPFG